MSILVLGALLVGVNLFFVQAAMLGIVSLLIYIFGLFLVLRARFDSSVKNPGLWIMIMITAGAMILTSAAYYANGLYDHVIFGILLIPLLLGAKNTGEYSLPLLKQKKLVGNESLFIVFFFLIEVALFALLFEGRTTELLRSPWHALPATFFLLYAGSTGLLFAFLKSFGRSPISYIASAIHLFLTYAVAAIMYPLGFGFDAFVHRAAETWILENGFIAPKTPYYIGQYGLVAVLSKLTRIPLFYIDVYLVPVLASLTIPAVLPLLRKKFDLRLIWILPFVPFLAFHLTTPYNLGLLLCLLTIVAVNECQKKHIPFLIPLLISIAALLAHPLIGAPTLVWFLVSALYLKQKKRWYLVLGLLAMIFVVPVMFLMQQTLATGSLPAFSELFARGQSFWSLFERPYWYAKEAALRFELLYWWQPMIPLVALALGLFGAWKKKNDAFVHTLLFASAGLAIGAYLLRTGFHFTDVAAYEQGDYPLRMLKAALLFLVPAMMIALEKLFATKNKFAVPVLAGVFLMVSFYLTYPQHNPKARYPGLNVTQSDVNAVHWIAEQHEEKNYVVLANQLVSAAALREFSFAHRYYTDLGELFYYSVPTGGPLYQHYGDMLYQGQKRETMDKVLTLTGAETAYFVVNDYWADSDKIIEGAKKTADSFTAIDDGKVWIFSYGTNEADSQ